MSPAHANKVRKAISKKIPQDLAVWKDEFINGASDKLGRTKAAAVWKDLEASADYAFAKAHAVGYSMLTLLTAYLKYYYPIEYITSALSRLKSSNKNDRMKMLTYLLEVKRLGIRVRMPHVNKSDIHISIQTDEEGDYIRFGLESVKGIGPKTAKRILDGAPYASYEALTIAAEQKYSGISSGVLAALNAVGAAAFEDNPRTGNEPDNYYKYLNVPSLAYDLPPDIKAQFATLDEHDESATYVTMAMCQQITRKDNWQRVDFLDETDVKGIFTSFGEEYETGQIYVLLVSNNTVIEKCRVEELDSSIIGKFLGKNDMSDVPDAMYKVLSLNTRITKAGKRMGDIVLVDNEKNLFGAIVWPSTYPQVHTLCKPGNVVDIELKEMDDGKLSVERIL